MIKNLHPEVIREVWHECKILRDRHPNLNGEIIWNMARDFVYAQNMADTALFKHKYQIELKY